MFSTCGSSAWVKPRLHGEAYMVRYLDDFVVCFQYRADALRVQEVLRKRLAKFNLTLEPQKTKLVELGRFAARHAPKRGRRRPETIYFVGFTLYCTRNRGGGYKVGIRTEKSRIRPDLGHAPRPDATDAARAGSRAGREPEPPLARALCVLRSRGQFPGSGAHRPSRRALLAQDAQ